MERLQDFLGMTHVCVTAKFSDFPETLLGNI